MTREKTAPGLAIVGASSLLGKELKQVLEDRNFPAAETALLDTTLPTGTLAGAAGEATFLKPMERESFEDARVVFFAGSPEEASANWKLARDAGATIVDLTGGLDEHPGAAPWIPELDHVLAPPEKTNAHARTPGVYSSPSPAVRIAVTLAAAWREFSTQRLAIAFFPPVSERGQAGVDELEKQTADLLLLRPVSQTVFDAQVAFNLLAGYGENSRSSMAELRRQIARGTGEYLAGRAAIPAVQLIQAPVFYGYAFCAYAEVSGVLDAQALEAALRYAAAEVITAGNPLPTNVSVAGEAKIQIAHIKKEQSAPGSAWIWGLADNLRLSAVNAVQIAEALFAPKI